MKYHYKHDIHDHYDEFYKTKDKNFFPISDAYSRQAKFSKLGFSVLTQRSFSDGTLISMQLLSDPCFVEKIEIVNPFSTNNRKKHMSSLS
jgi:hypothetical protein